MALRTEAGSPVFQERETLLEIKGLSFWYGDPQTHAPTLEGVDLSVRKGEVVALVGESGSGKSTLINCIIGLHSARNFSIQAQKLRFGNHQLATLTSSEWRKLRGRHIAYVAQDPAGSLDPLLTVGEQLLETLRFFRPDLSREHAKREVLELMRRVGFTEPAQVYSRYPHQLSGGMNQRVSIAAALSGTPDLLLADEPTSALDVSVQKRVLDHFSDLVVETATSVLFITHDLAVAADRAERVVVLQKGRVLEDGSVTDVIDQPQHSYTQELLGAAPFLKSNHDPNTSLKRSPAALPDVTPLLQVRSLEKSFTGKEGDKVSAVKSVDLHVLPGETVCVVGESGSGKTTLARSILRLNDLDGGVVTFNGYDVSTLKQTGLKGYRREAQMVYQNPFASLDLRYRVDAILREPLQIHGTGNQAEQKLHVRRMLDLVGLPESFLERRPGELSGGQRQRVAIARALITSPRLLILDEAVSALDVSVQARILDLLRNVQQELGLAYLFITHDLAVVKSFSDRVYVMKHGEVVESGPTPSVFDAPRHDYTRLLIAAAPGQLAQEKLTRANGARPPQISVPGQLLASR